MQRQNCQRRVRLGSEQESVRQWSALSVGLSQGVEEDTGELGPEGPQCACVSWSTGLLWAVTEERMKTGHSVRKYLGGKTMIP